MSLVGLMLFFTEGIHHVNNLKEKGETNIRNEIRETGYNGLNSETGNPENVLTFDFDMPRYGPPILLDSKTTSSAIVPAVLLGSEDSFSMRFRWNSVRSGCPPLPKGVPP